MKVGDVILTRRNAYRILRVQAVGGYGQILAAIRERDNELVAIKFCNPLTEEARKDPLCDEIEANAIQRFNDETSLLRKLPHRPYFPKYFEKGVHEGRPFFVMEALSTLSEAEWPPKSDSEKIRFVCDLCSAVQDLHDLGYVHYDIKPSNLMCRLDGNLVDHWVLIDFGSAHEKEDDVRIENCLTRSMLSDGRRIVPSTPGYADPVWKLHSVCFDIYSIGQVIRDMFDGDVPLHWSRIVNRCISRNLKYRYDTVEDIEGDVLNLKKNGVCDMRNQLHGWMVEDVARQERMLRASPRVMPWEELREELRVSRRVDAMWLSDDCPFEFANGVLAEVSNELMIDPFCPRRRHIEITTPVVFRNERLIVLKGPGIIEMDLSVSKGSQHFILLVDNVTLVNTSRQVPDANSVRYFVGTGCYLNFAGLSKSEVDVDAVRLSLAGGAFVRCRGPETLLEVIREMEDSWDGLAQCQTTESDNGRQRLRDEYVLISGLFNDAMGIPRK